MLGSGGLVVEFGCGSGLLTRELVAAGHRVLATDASPAMLALARETAPGAEGFAVLALPDDPLPRCDAIVGVGHPINYLPSLEAIQRALGAMADALRPGGILAFDVCDLAYGQARQDAPSRGWASSDWALVTEFSLPSADRFVRQMAVFSRNGDGTWRRDDERHDNVLVDTATIPERAEGPRGGRRGPRRLRHGGQPPGPQGRRRPQGRAGRASVRRRPAGGHGGTVAPPASTTRS